MKGRPSFVSRLEHQLPSPETFRLTSPICLDVDRKIHNALVRVALGSVLRRLRETKNLPQKVLAERAQIDSSYLSQLERGIRQPTVAVLINLGAALEVEPAQVITLLLAEMERRRRPMAEGGDSRFGSRRR